MTFVIPQLSQYVSLALTLILCGCIGLEREYHGKNAGIRTNILVGLGSWLFSLSSVLGANAIHVTSQSWDGSRIAAQIVSGIGFIGAGVIFYNKSRVKGLTTAAGIWVSAAIGMGAAFNLQILVLLVTFCYFLTVLVIAPSAYRLLRRFHICVLHITYENGKGSLRNALLKLSEAGFETQVLSSHQVSGDSWAGASVDVRVDGNLPSNVFDSIVQIEGIRDITLDEEAES
ncbi:MgtC/SapB family protein [Bifidobacterium aquikefiri]|uniref:Magnesium transporter MgtC n=1 Tax=Bifidobacterium aquikefiri TaxID=1653207 RepID=A0A261GAB6_9BIFI|nr:MgtC/SapB family protein [Bifidobacterium aquikefiri]OZG68377.1 magnesium transporter MgtC [Bifidobacterium aquikefiri]